MHFSQILFFLIFLKVTKSNTNPDDLGGLANELTNEFGNLANEAKYAAMTAENDEVNSQAYHSSSVYLSITLSYTLLFVSRLVLTLKSKWVSWVSAVQDWWQKLELYSAVPTTPLQRKSWLRVPAKSLRRSDNNYKCISFHFFVFTFSFCICHDIYLG